MLPLFYTGGGGNGMAFTRSSMSSIVLIAACLINCIVYHANGL